MLSVLEKEASQMTFNYKVI